MTEAACPLCHSRDLQPWHEDRQRCYLRCPRCALVSVPARYHLKPAAEKAVYDLHQNAADDSGYRRFLSRVAEPLLARLPAGASGLDFGCGPGPVLAEMLAAAGHSVALYDKFYFPDASVLQGAYDFITATEVVEHLEQPRAVLEQLTGLLRPAGWLAIMTKRVRDQAAFARWHYIQDPTHIVFFADHTFIWLAQHLGCQLTVCGPDVVLLQKA